MRKKKISAAESAAALKAQAPATKPVNKSLQYTLAQALNSCIAGTYRSLEVDFTDANGGAHIAHIYRCSPELVRVDFKVKK